MEVTRLATIAGLMLALLGCGAESAQTQVTVETEDDKLYYALGLATAQGLGAFKGKLTADQIELVKLGLGDAAAGKEELVKLEEYGPKLQELVQQLVEAEKEKSQAFLEQAATEEGAVKTASGLIYTELLAGTGAQPAAANTVKVHYHGTLVDGSVFDSSVDRGEPITFPLGNVIPGWQEGLQMMKVGGKARLVIPSDLAYGDQGRPGTIPGGSTLIFEVELLGIE
jgi:FKBP-type peptidyl-prolyl cis-trans isomerase FkpA